MPGFARQVSAAAPVAPAASGGEESIIASSYTPGATLKLYLTNGVLQATAPNVTEPTYTFESVVPNNLGFYVTQTVGGEESVNSSFVGASLRTPIASAGIGYVDVSNVFAGATLTLYDDQGQSVSSSPTDQGSGVWRFEGLAARSHYYIVQSVNGVVSGASATVTVQADVPAAPAASGGEESIGVSGYTPGATLKLYLTNGQLQATAPNITEPTYTFESVVPHHLGFYVTQTVGGEESVNSSFVGASLRTPIASAGIGYVDVTNVFAGATVTLYDDQGQSVSSSPTDQGNGVWRFGGLAARSHYYILQSVNGVVSSASATVTVLADVPAAPSASGGEESIIASSYTPGATLKLYLTNGVLQATAPNVTEPTYTFESVVPNNLGFYVTQTVGGEESVNSSFVGASLRTPSASAGIGNVDVSNVFAGATVTLYDDQGQSVSSSPTDQGNGVWRFEGLDARSHYYIVQSVNGVVSSASATVTVLADVPAAPAASGGEESIDVSGYTPGATLKLYLTNGVLQATAPNVTEPTYTFESVVPNNLDFYVTQTVGGEESVNSSFVGASLRIPSASAGIGFVDVTNVYPGATVTLYDHQDHMVSSSPTDQGAGTWRFGGLDNGNTYYVIQDINGVLSQNSYFATLPDVPRAPEHVQAAAGNGQAIVTFTIPADGGSPITGYEVFHNGDSVATGDAGSNSITITGLTNGLSYAFTVKAINAVGSSEASAASEAVTPSEPYIPGPTPKSVDVLVNGKVENAGTATFYEANGQSVAVIAVNEDKLRQRLEAEGNHAAITILVPFDSNVVVGELNGQMVSELKDKHAVVELHTGKASYTLPSDQMNIDAIAKLFGPNVALQDIKIRIEIAEPQTDTLHTVEDAVRREGLSLAASPFNFKVSAVYGGRTEEVSTFSVYVERSITVPDGFTSNRLTTGIVVEPDGTLRHVPTIIESVNGNLVARINSLTNSTYALVWNPLEFEDVAHHWAKTAVNNMGSRLVVEESDNGMFSPDRVITRAEFAAIVVRGLGLRLTMSDSPFGDVRSSDWFNSAVQTAYQYGLIKGFEDGTFRPDASITREQAMHVIANAMKITGLSNQLDNLPNDAFVQAYDDAAKIGSWAISDIAQNVRLGIVTGRSRYLLAPKDFMTRAEAATILERLLQKSNLIQ
jgi:hypothetical protein